MKQIKYILFLSIITISIALIGTEIKAKSPQPKINLINFMPSGKSEQEKQILKKAIAKAKELTFDEINKYLIDPQKFFKSKFVQSMQLPKVWNVEWDEVEGALLNYITYYSPNALQSTLYNLKFRTDDLTEMEGNLELARKKVIDSIVANASKYSENPSDFRPMTDAMLHLKNIITNVFTSQRAKKFFADLDQEIKRIRANRIIPNKYADVLEVLKFYYETLLKSLEALSNTLEMLEALKEKAEKKL